MFAVRFKHVCIEGFGLHLPEYKVSSNEIEDRLAELYKELKVPFGTLEKLSGIKERGVFSTEEPPSHIATQAGKEALDSAGIDKDKIQAVFNCSVTRDYFEPATAILVHENLGFSEHTIAMDMTNACVGFSNGMLMLANLIESGVVKAGLVVAGENMAHITDKTFEKLLGSEKINRTELLKMMPTFTLGSGAVAMVLCHESLATRGHRYLGSVARSASQFKELCVGNGDFCFLQEQGLNPLMETDSQKLMAAAAKLGNRTWKDASGFFEWTTEDIDHIFCHQVGKQVNSAFYKTMGLPMEKEHTVYETYGNLVSAAMPSALITVAQEGKLERDNKILTLGFGSGLNSIFSAIQW